MNGSLPTAEFLHGPPTAARGTLRVAELFTSRQGEGKLTGTETFFVRTSGCNLRCWFCDTPYASWHPRGDTMSIDQIVEAARRSGRQHVVLTGGEPLLPTESTALARALQQAGFHLTIETAGTIDRPVQADLMSISPKFASSAPSAETQRSWHQRHQQRRLRLDVMRSLMARAEDFQLKFVVDSPADFSELIQIVDGLQTAADAVWVMPQGSTVDKLDEAAGWLKPWCQRQGFHFCDRMQIRWFGNRRGT